MPAPLPALLPLLPGITVGNRGPEAWGAQLAACCTLPGPSPSGCTGCAGCSGCLTGLLASFTFLTPSPLFLAPALAGQIVDGAILILDVPFNDPAAALQLGTSADPSALFSAAQNSPFLVGQQLYPAIYIVPTSGSLQLSISPAASTQGSGSIFLRLR